MICIPRHWRPEHCPVTIYTTLQSFILYHPRNSVQHPSAYASKALISIPEAPDADTLYNIDN
jgi:hypothetical protein